MEEEEEEEEEAEEGVYECVEGGREGGRKGRRGTLSPRFLFFWRWRRGGRRTRISSGSSRGDD